MVRFPIAVVAVSFLAAGYASGQESEADIYKIDAARSDIHWQVYSAGTFSALGHNHVISVAEMDGRVYLHEDGGAPSRFEIEVPVETLVVDDPDLRARKGEKFESEPSDEDIAGTRQNMLGEDVLNSERYPTLRVTGTLASASGDLEDATLALNVYILGTSHELSAPAHIVVDGDTLTAEGMLALTHEDLGMDPFSIMLGALAVAEDIDLFYRVVATRVDSP